MGKAVVSTTVGAEGLGLEPGHHSYPQTIRRRLRCRRIALRDPDQRRALGAQDVSSSRPTTRGRRSRASSKQRL